MTFWKAEKSRKNKQKNISAERKMFVIFYYTFNILPEIHSST